ncbi:MAG: hypothetical protein AABY89_12945 [Acidobacteriota bacterium]
MDPVAEIKQLYYAATRTTIQRDLKQAIELLKTLSSEEERERVAVYMDGLSQMRSEWHASSAPAGSAARRTKPTRNRPTASGPDRPA